MIAGVVFIESVPVGLSGERNDRFRTDAGWIISVKEDGAVHITGETTSGRTVDFLVYDVPYTIVHQPSAVDAATNATTGAASELPLIAPAPSRTDATEASGTLPQTQPAPEPKRGRRGPRSG